MSCSFYRSQEINRICGDPDKLAKFEKHHDFQTAIPVCTLKVAKAEGKSCDDFVKDSILDLMACYEKGLLSSLSFPLKFEVIKEEHLDILKSRKNNSFDGILYLDATGSLMEKSNFFWIVNLQLFF